MALVLEKNDFIVEEISRRLLSMLHRFVVVRNQMEAYRQLKEKRFDYILLNHCLPVQENSQANSEVGFNVLECIRVKLGIPDKALPIIVMSNCRKDMESGTQFIRAGANACIPIPLEEAKESLEVKIRRVLEERVSPMVEEYKRRDITIPSIQLSSLPYTVTPPTPFLQIDVAQELVYCQGQSIPLQHMQFKLLLVLARSPGTWVDKRRTIYNAMFGQADPKEDHRPYEGQIDKTKSNLIKAFKTMLKNEAGRLILTKSKVGLKLNVTRKDIKIIEDP
jgi:DNA-binding response OmpR family regulator